MATDHNFKVKNGLDVEGANIKIVDGGSGNALLDASGDIILDADGSDILFKDGGTQFGSIRKNGNNIQLMASIQDGDISFHGDDGGSAINALHLDMSQSGQATFNSNVAATSFFGQNIYITSSGFSAVNRIDNDGSALYLTYGGTSNRALEVNNSTGAVVLKYNANTKLETTSTGATITGSLKTDRIECLTDSLDTFTFIDFDMDTGGSSGTNNLVLGGVNNVDFLIDTNNNSTDSSFVFGTNANTMGSATELMRLTEAGNVGIGTSSPANKLHVSDGGGAGLEINPQTANDRVILFAYDRNTSTYQSMDFDALDYHFNPGGTEKMRLTNDGKLGILKSAPLDQLHVTGVIRTQMDGNNNKYIRVFGGNSGNFLDTHRNSLFIRPNGNTSLAVVIDTAGNVGIGTASPGEILTLDDTNPKLGLRDAGTERAYLQVDASDHFLINNKSISSTKFYTSDAVRFIITSNGYLRVNHDNAWDSLGTLTVKQKADGQGIGIIDTDGQNTLEILNEGNLAQFFYNVNNPIVFSQVGGERMRINADGTITVSGGAIAGAGIQTTSTGTVLEKLISDHSV